MGDNPLVPVNSKVQNEIQAQSKHLTAKMPSNFLDKLQEMLKPSDSAIKGSGLIVGMSAVLIAATAVTNPIAASMLLCAGMSVSLQVITDCIEGNKTSISSLVTSAAVGAVSGAAAGAAAVATEAAITKIGYDVASHFAVATVSGVSGAAYDVTTQLVTTGKVDAKEVILSTALAFGTGYALSKGSEVVANKLNSKATVKTETESVIRIEEPYIPEGSLYERNVFNSFAGGEYKLVTYKEGTVFYRVGGDLGGFWSIQPPPVTEYQWRVDFAIKQEFNNNASKLYKITIPNGYSVSGFEGKVGSQGMGLYGGAHQIYIDYKAVPDEWIKEFIMQWR